MHGYDPAQLVLLSWSWCGYCCHSNRSPPWIIFLKQLPYENHGLRIVLLCYVPFNSSSNY
uniref:Uncharacterized protein n=1 Tax=Arundo donax TaxID=35708 RepID=A0A0A9DH25_ARUDO